MKAEPKSVRVAGKLLQPGEYVSLCRGVHVGRRGRYQGKYRGKLLITLNSGPGGLARICVDPSEIRPLESANR